MKYYVLKDLNDPTKLKIENRSSADGTICRAPKGERIEWLDIVDHVDEDTGKVLGKKAVVNATKKEQHLLAFADHLTKIEDTNTKRQARRGKMLKSMKKMDAIVADPVRLARLLRRMMIEITQIEEEQDDADV